MYLVVSSESWDERDSSFSLRIVSRILQTTDVSLMGLNRLGSVVRGFFCDWSYSCVAPIFRDLCSLE